MVRRGQADQSFPGLWHTAAGVIPMRHGDINLTMSRYSHVRVGQESDAVAGLPDLFLPAREAAALTGTDPVARQIARVRLEAAKLGKAKGLTARVRNV
jgi:hypothetical protein